MGIEECRAEPCQKIESAQRMRRQDLIMDIGAHAGDDTRFYLDKGFAVVAVEANPVLVVELKERFSEDIEKGFLTIEPFAIGSRDESMRFFVHRRQTLFSSLTPNVQLHGDE